MVVLAIGAAQELCIYILPGDLKGLFCNCVLLWVTIPPVRHGEKIGRKDQPSGKLRMSRKNNRIHAIMWNSPGIHAF